jgi:small membrane protein
MLQQIIALIIIAFFLSRLYWQKQKNYIGFNEFLFWLVFWLAAALLIISLKAIDKLVAELGFTGTGIEVLLYLSIAILFYLVFRIRLKLEKIEKDITKIVKNIAIKDKDNL